MRNVHETKKNSHIPEKDEQDARPEFLYQSEFANVYSGIIRESSVS